MKVSVIIKSKTINTREAKIITCFFILLTEYENITIKEKNTAIVVIFPPKFREIIKSIGKKKISILKNLKDQALSFSIFDKKNPKIINANEAR